MVRGNSIASRNPEMRTERNNRSALTTRSNLLAKGLTALLALVCCTTRAANYIVGVEDSFFEPPQLAINVGDSVRWNGNGGQDHTVTSDDALFDVVMPFGDTFTYTFSAPGRYPYYCANHGGPGGEGMSGAIVVSAAGVNHPPHTPVNQAPVNGATNQAL